MDFVNPRRHRILAVKDTAPPSGEELRVICALDCMAGNREGTSSRAETIFLPGKPAPVHIWRAIIPGHRTQGFSENTGWNDRGLGLHPDLTVSAIRSIPHKGRQEADRDHYGGRDSQL